MKTWSAITLDRKEKVILSIDNKFMLTVHAAINKLTDMHLHQLTTGCSSN